jgi:predicted PP-loop superfamily ATPase
VDRSHYKRAARLRELKKRRAGESERLRHNQRGNLEEAIAWRGGEDSGVNSRATPSCGARKTLTDADEELDQGRNKSKN